MGFSHPFSTPRSFKFRAWDVLRILGGTCSGFRVFSKVPVECFGGPICSFSGILVVSGVSVAFFWWMIETSQMKLGKNIQREKNPMLYISD